MLTRHGVVLGADVREDGRLYFAAMDGAGVDIRTFMPAPRPVGLPISSERQFPSVVTPVTVEPRDYGAGPLDATPLLAGAFSQIANTSEYGVRLGDPVGRWEMLASASLGDPEGVSGGGVQAAWRGFNPEVLAAAWITQGSGPLGSAWTSGGWLGIRGDTASPAGRLVAEFGVAGEQRLDGAIRALFATAEAKWGVIEPRRAGLGGYGAIRAQGGQSGERFALLAGDTLVSLGQSWGLDLAYGAGITAGPRPFSLGGVDTGVVAPADRWGILVAPAYAPGASVGRLYDETEFALVTPAIVAFGQRWRVADVLGPHAATLVGLKVENAFGRQPLARFAAFESEFGLGLRVEDPAAGWLRRAPVWADFAGWGGLKWEL